MKDLKIKKFPKILKKKLPKELYSCYKFIKKMNYKKKPDYHYLKCKFAKIINN